MKNKILLFSSKTCPNCESARMKLKDFGRQYETLDVETVDGKSQAVFYGVQSTPTIIIIDENDNELDSFRGTVPMISDLERYFD